MYKTDHIGTVITELRTEYGLKQKVLSDMLGMTPGNLSNYEKGVYWPSLDTLCKLADLFHVTTDYLLGRTAYRCPPETLDPYVNAAPDVSHIFNLLLTMDEQSLEIVAKFADFLKSEENNQKHGKTPGRKSNVPLKRT